MNPKQPDFDSQDRNQEALHSWKEIAAYIQRNEASARRWEREEGLPVHRHSHKIRSSVFAFPGEIDAWLAGRRIAPEPAVVRPWWRPVAIGVTTLLCLIMVGNGIRPQSAAAQAPEKSPRQLWIATSAHPDLPNAGNSVSPGSISRDGRLVSFTDDSTGDLGIHDLTTGTSRRLTNTGGWEASGDWAEQSVISSDGRSIAYTWFFGNGSASEVRIIPAGGGKPRTIYRTQGMQDYLEPFGWTPDGKQLLVLHYSADWSKQFATLSIAEGSLRVVKTVGWIGVYGPRLSPDGRWIAYHSPVRGPTDRDVFILAVNGSAETDVTPDSSDDIEPFWSADGSRLFFASNRTGNSSLWSVPVANGKASGPATLAKSDLDRIRMLGITDRGALLYVRNGKMKSNIYSARLDADGKISKPPALAVDQYVGGNQGPSLSPDGRSLAYYSNRPGLSLVIRTLETRTERVVPVAGQLGVVQGYGPMWFPDGRSVLAGLYQAPIGAYRVDLESGRAESVWPLQKPIETYTLSPDGRAIYYTGVMPGDPKQYLTTRLMRYDLAARRLTELKSDGSARINNPVVSRDGKQLAYAASIAPGGQGYLAVMPAGGGESREVFRGQWRGTSRLNTMAWSADQRYIYFVRGGVADDGPNVLWRVPAAGGDAERVGDLGSGVIRSPQPVADGTIFFTLSTFDPNEVWQENAVLQGELVPQAPEAQGKLRH